MTETIAEILAAHRAGAATPADTVARSFARIRAHGDAAVFISLREEADAVADAVAAEGRTDLPLYGVPVAIKDNIDVKGMPTTAACPAFAYQAARDATCVARLKRAGAIVIGKTNLDQFATGLNGTRSPYGTPRNAFKPGLIPGGSSSGSAVAVAAGALPIALGTDTAGSGRVPAMLNNIVGLKPSLGLISNYGVVPACRTLDCVSVFALTTDDAWSVLAAISGVDPNDPYSRAAPIGALGAPAGLRLGVPTPGARVFFGDKLAAAAYDEALERLKRLGATIVEIDIEPFYETARLLYEGPWVAERLVATRSLLAASPEAMHPVTREIIAGASRVTAADAFAAFYKLEELRRVADKVFREIGALALPAAPTVYTVEADVAGPDLAQQPARRHTNFVNLLDLCGLAVPASVRPDGAPFGITLLAPSGADAGSCLAGPAVPRRHRAAAWRARGAAAAAAVIVRTCGEDEVALGVVRAHLSACR